MPPQLADKSDLHHDLDQLLWSCESSTKQWAFSDTLTKKGPRRPQKQNCPIIVP